MTSNVTPIALWRAIPDRILGGGLTEAPSKYFADPPRDLVAPKACPVPTSRSGEKGGAQAGYDRAIARNPLREPNRDTSLARCTNRSRQSNGPFCY